MELVVDFWDVGQGDCSVVRLPDEQLLIIDVGPPDSPLIEWLTARGEKIYGVVLTHNDEDHAGCFPDLLERFSTRIGKVFLLVDRDPTSVPAQRILGCAVRYAKKKHFTLHQLALPENEVLKIYGHDSGAEKLLIYGVHPEFLTALGNELKSTPKPNNVSGIICLDIDGMTHLIWAGDAPMKTVGEKCSGKAPEVMVGPHHGGPTDRGLKNHDLEYDKVNPRNVFISVGTTNRHDHPVKKFIDSHAARKRRVVCSQLVHCDNRKVEARQHVMRHHLDFGMVPPQNAGAVTCRGPMRLTWDTESGEFAHDEYHALHLAELESVHRPYCLGGLMAHHAEV